MTAPHATDVTHGSQTAAPSHFDVKVLRQEGIAQEGHATMPRFDEELGNKA